MLCINVADELLLLEYWAANAGVYEIIQQLEFCKFGLSSSLRSQSFSMRLVLGVVSSDLVEYFGQEYSYLKVFFVLQNVQVIFFTNSDSFILCLQNEVILLCSFSFFLFHLFLLSFLFFSSVVLLRILLTFHFQQSLFICPYLWQQKHFRFGQFLLKWSLLLQYQHLFMDFLLPLLWYLV